MYDPWRIYPRPPAQDHITLNTTFTRRGLTKLLICFLNSCIALLSEPITASGLVMDSWWVRPNSAARAGFWIGSLTVFLTDSTFQPIISRLVVNFPCKELEDLTLFVFRQRIQVGPGFAGSICGMVEIIRVPGISGHPWGAGGLDSLPPRPAHTSPAKRKLQWFLSHS